MDKRETILNDIALSIRFKIVSLLSLTQYFLNDYSWCNIILQQLFYLQIRFQIKSYTYTRK